MCRVGTMPYRVDVCDFHRRAKACTLCFVLCLMLHAHPGSHRCCWAHDQQTHSFLDPGSSSSTNRESRSVPASTQIGPWGEWHAPGYESPSTDSKPNLYLRKLFQKYGDNGVITYEAFEHLLENLGLGNIAIADHGLADHFVDGNFQTLHDDHDHAQGYGTPKTTSFPSGTVAYHDDDPHYDEGLHVDDKDHVHHDHDMDHTNHEHEAGSHEHHDDDHDNVQHETDTHDVDRGHVSGGSLSQHDGADSNSAAISTSRSNLPLHPTPNPGHFGMNAQNQNIPTDIGHHNDSDFVQGKNETEESELPGDQLHEDFERGHHDHEHGGAHHHHNHSSTDSRELIKTDNDRSSHISPKTADTIALVNVTVARLKLVPSTPKPTAVMRSNAETQSVDHDTRGNFREHQPSRHKRNVQYGSQTHNQGHNVHIRDVLFLSQRPTSVQINSGVNNHPRLLRRRKVIAKKDSVATPYLQSPPAVESARAERNHHLRGKPSVRSSAQHSIAKRFVEEQQQCLSVKEMLVMYHIRSTGGISEEDFVQLCPAIVAQLDARACFSKPITRNHGHDHNHKHNDGVKAHEAQPKYGPDHEARSGLGHNHDTDHDHEHDHGGHYHDHNDSDSIIRSYHVSQVSGQVWGYAVLSVTVISLVGLLGVAVVPIMQKVFYNHLLQFLVALAVGSLTGDAFLHLIPHAMMGGHGAADSHDHGHAADDFHSAHDHSTDIGGQNASVAHSHDHRGVWYGLVALGGVYFFFLMERLMGMITTWKRKNNHKKRRSRSPNTYKAAGELDHEAGTKLSTFSENIQSCEEIVMVVHPNKGVKGIADDYHEEIHQACDPEEREQFSHSHSNQHSHGHSHGDHVPGSVAAVAWMVIMGDGLHNFSDGLAIGAAFANSMTGGLSTSIAVFCHELPHEIGDFAVLLRAGMSVKQALVYNVVSSVLCYIGMIVGVCAGNIGSVSLWIFSLAAGMFIYIALVDMLPELTAMQPKEGEHPLCHLGLQSLGLMVGASIMLLIAIYEDQIQVPHFEP